MGKLFVVIVCSFLLLSCGGDTPRAGGDNVLRIATSYKIQSLAPQESASYFLVEYGIAETPLFISDNSEIRPHLLESYAQIDDNSWKLFVRDGLFFHNGKAVTAEKVAAAMYFQIKNSPATRSVLSGVTITAVGERELLLKTDYPNPGVPAALADESGFPIFDIDCIEPANGDNKKLIEGGCYTGPYRPVSLDDREMMLKNFSKYWRGTPPLDKIFVKFIPDAQVRMLAVQSGEIDVALYPPSEAKRTLANQPKVSFVTSETSTNGPRLFFNVRRAPFDDTAVRRAAALGIKYDSIAKDVFDGVFQTAYGYYPPIFPFAVQNQKTDISEAKRLLDEAGWTSADDGTLRKNGVSLSAVLLTYPQQPDWVILATALQANLREIGFDVTIRQVEDINAAMRATDWNFGIISPGITTYGGAPDPLLREFLTTNGEKNYVGLNDSELDQLIETLSRTLEPRKRNELLQRIQQIVIVEKAYEARPLFSRSRAVVSSRFKNYKPSPYLHHVTFDTQPPND